jgi:hypothetical protein
MAAGLESMKNIKFSGPFAVALMAALIDIAGILIVLLLLDLGPYGFKSVPKWVDVLGLVFLFPGMIYNPLLWALGGIVFYYLRRAIRNGAFHIAR